jgi:hypothetical protein
MTNYEFKLINQIKTAKKRLRSGGKETAEQKRARLELLENKLTELRMGKAG